MLPANSSFVVRRASTPADLSAAQRLRYTVFVDELGGDGPDVNHETRHECDAYDVHATHLLLEDTARPKDDCVVGVYRLMTSEQARAAGGFYCAAEFDLSELIGSGRRLLELGRSCLHPNYRGGTAMLHLWAALADFARNLDTEILFGAASFHGTDLTELAEPLSNLADKHLAGGAMTVTAKAPNAVPMTIIPVDQIDRKAAMRATPALIKAYLRLGGVVGQGAYVDHAFNTTDICLILDTAQMNARAAALYGAGDQI
ncbi:MAG: putative hemolysin [Gammaproteobacteria bacterium]|jgi:putative hemolysin